MGTSGTAIFSDDTACDVRREFLELLRGGFTSDEAVDVLKKNRAFEIEDIDDGPQFWFALAATQWSYGCLSDEVKSRAIEIIDSGADLVRWSGPSLGRRRNVLAALKSQLLSPQRNPRRPRKQKQVEPPPKHEAPAPDGRGKAVAFHLPGAEFMQVYLERVVGDSRGGGSVFVAECAFDDVDLEWLPKVALQITYPKGTKVEQRSDTHFFCGEVIHIIYRTKNV
jgi:hypothetical protein